MFFLGINLFFCRAALPGSCSSEQDGKTAAGFQKKEFHFGQIKVFKDTPGPLSF